MGSMNPPKTNPVIVWFRDDLRLADNPALAAAIARGSPLVAVYILDDETPGRWRLGQTVAHRVQVALQNQSRSQIINRFSGTALLADG